MRGTDIGGLDRQSLSPHRPMLRLNPGTMLALDTFVPLAHLLYILTVTHEHDRDSARRPTNVVQTLKPSTKL
jgi:hypothetical protein